MLDIVYYSTRAGAHDDINIDLLLARHACARILAHTLYPRRGEALLATQMGCDGGALLATACNLGGCRVEVGRAPRRDEKRAAGGQSVGSLCTRTG